MQLTKCIDITEWCSFADFDVTWIVTILCFPLFQTNVLTPEYWKGDLLISIEIQPLLTTSEHNENNIMNSMVLCRRKILLHEKCHGITVGRIT